MLIIIFRGISNLFFGLQYIASLWLTGTCSGAFTMAVIPDFKHDIFNIRRWICLSNGRIREIANNAIT